MDQSDHVTLQSIFLIIWETYLKTIKHVIKFNFRKQKKKIRKTYQQLQLTVKFCAEFSLKAKLKDFFIVFCCIFQNFIKIFCKMKMLSHMDFYRNLVTWSGWSMALRTQIIFNSFNKSFQFAIFCRQSYITTIPFNHLQYRMPKIYEKVEYIVWTPFGPVSSLSNKGCHGRRTLVRKNKQIF